MDEYQLKNFLKFAPARLGLTPKKHLFIHIPKNGGMAIRHAKALEGTLVLANRRRLKSKSYADAVKDQMQRSGGQPSYEHARFRDVDLSVRRATRPFAIVRNPWSRTLSRFKFAVQTRGAGGAEIAFTRVAFEAFLDERHEWGGVDYFWHRAIRGWFPQKDYLVDENGHLSPDILRQEYLGKELKQYLRLESDLERRNVSKASADNDMALYTDNMIQIVADWYADDIELFGFDFDTPASRNTHYAQS